MRNLHDLSYIYVIMWHIMQVMVRVYSPLRMLEKSGKIRESLIATRCCMITFQVWNKKKTDFQTFLSLDIDFWRTNELLVQWKPTNFRHSYNKKISVFRPYTRMSTMRKVWYHQIWIQNNLDFIVSDLPYTLKFQPSDLVALYSIWKMRDISFFPHSDCLLMFNSFWIFTDSRHETDFSRTWIAWPYKRSRILEVDDDDEPGLSEPRGGGGGGGGGG